MASWEAARRLDYIDFRLLTAGTLRREDIMRTFGVSMPQASKDIAAFERLYWGAIEYDRRAKRYRPAAGYTTRRGLTPYIVAGIQSLAVADCPMGWR